MTRIMERGRHRSWLSVDVLSPALPCVCLLVPLALLGPGCRATPAQNWYTAAETYTNVLETLVTLRNAGKINDAMYVQIEEVRIVARAAIDEAELLIARGAPAYKISDALRAAAKALDKLVQYRIQAGR